MALNNFIDKRKARKSETMIVDESGLAKSAAWAWYERGSGSDGRPIKEVDVWMSKPEPKPSRYKLEALRNLQRDQHINSSKNSLLDNYEIERISKQLDRYIEASHVNYNAGDQPTAAAANFVKRRMLKGFWSRRVPACGSSRSDVVENRIFECRQKLPEKVRLRANPCLIQVAELR
ncbi:uncharacterized protein LOC131021937 [Salvia miltiorrhiza]|uniref:uncharacterized protein LOC131021937 n=1 Tax=Salvia miltiorrhiza TaxID=226208 RepID=UPI0025ACAEF9|nr:uncharacterized protein LOC131021937 [Salvia miltiorrhiza]